MAQVVQPAPPLVDDSDPIDEFPEDVRQDVHGLLWLGHLEDTFKFAGHSFILRTLKAQEELFVGVLSKEYQDTLGQANAYKWAHVCQALVAVDNDHEFCPPIAADALANARGRFTWVTENWYPPLCNYLFTCYERLMARQYRALEAVQDLSPRSRPSSTPSEDSSNDQGDYKTVEMEAIQPFLEED